MAKKSDAELQAAIGELDMFSKGGQVWKRKKKKKVLSAWKQRYFHLKGGRIFYYASVSDVKSLGGFDLVTTNVKRLTIKDSSSHKYVFELSTFGSEYHIATETEEELLQWLNMISRVKDHIFSNGLQISSPSGRTKQKRGLSRLTLRAKKSSSSSAMQFAIGRSASTGDFNLGNSNSSGAKGKAAVVEEILTTERDYVADLLLVKDHYIFKLEDYGLMQRDQKEAIFGNILDLIPLHQELLGQLEIEARNASPNFGAIFAEVVSSKFHYFSVIDF